MGGAIGLALEAVEMGGEEEDDEEEEEDKEDEWVDRDERWRAGGREMEGGRPWWWPPPSANRADDIKWPLVARSIEGGVSGKGYPPGGW